MYAQSFYDLARLDHRERIARAAFVRRRLVARRRRSRGHARQHPPSRERSPLATSVLPMAG